MHLLKILSVMLILFSAAPASAQFRTMTLSEGRQSLLRLDGNWKGTGVWIHQGTTVPLYATWRCNKQINGYGVFCELDVEGADPYREVELFAIDDATGEVRWMCACTFGTVFDYRGQLSGQSLIAGDGYAKASLVFDGERKVQFRVAYGPDGIDGIVEFELTK
jgi:hypothetical protein